MSVEHALSTWPPWSLAISDNWLQLFDWVKKLIKRHFDFEAIDLLMLCEIPSDWLSLIAFF